MNKRRLFVVILAICIFLLFASSVIFQDVFFRATDALNAYSEAHPFWGASMFIALAMASALLSPFSSAPLVPSAVVIWGAEKTFVLLFAGWLLGNVATYAIGYYVGYPAMKRITANGRMDKWIKTLSERVDILIAFLFRLATPSETGYVFGTLRYNFFKYLCITFLAELPFAYGVVYASEAFITIRWHVFFMIGFVWLSMIGVAAHILDRRTAS